MSLMLMTMLMGVIVEQHDVDNNMIHD